MTVYIAIDLTQPVKDSILGVFLTKEQANACILSDINMRAVKMFGDEYLILEQEVL
jgi:hypothetical protein